MPKRIYTLSSFPSEFLDIWRLAMEGKLSLSFPSKGAATNFRMRLYMFRRIARQEAPILGVPLYEIDLIVMEKVDGSALLEAYIPPWKKQIRNQIGGGDLGKDAGPAAPLEVLTPPPTEPSSLDATLKSLGFGVEEKKEKE